MSGTKFTHLHVHSEYSLLDGLIKIPDLVTKAKDLKMDALALTDHGMMSGLLDFWMKCRENDIKPIIGCEVYISARTRFDKVPKVDDKRYHLLLLAKNSIGYHNLVKLVSLAHIEGFYYKPRVDRELLTEYSEGIICLSACDSNPINKSLLNKQPKLAKKWVKFFKETFNDFYIELQRNGIEQSEKLIPHLTKLAKEFNVPIVATCDVHYLEKKDWKAQEVLWAIADGKTLDDDTRRQAWSEEFYLKSGKEMVKLFKDLPEAIENTQKIADMIEVFDITYERVEPKLPEIPRNKTPYDYLVDLTYKGLENKYEKITEDLESQVKEELSIIKDKKYTKYFLVCWDLCKYARENDIWMGLGRGSAPSSVVAYSLGITGVEPRRWELPFERFLNPERDSPPDIDLDFQDDRRDEMFDYMHEKYGKDTIVNICTFGRMKTRAAIRDVARVLNIDLEIADRLSKMVTVKFGRVTKLDDMIKENPEFKQILNANPELQELADFVRIIEGVVRHVSMHACAMALAPKPMMEYIPVMLESRSSSDEKRIMTQIEGYPLEPMGFLKIDFLGLANMTILKRTVNLIKERKERKIVLNDIPINDKKTYELLQRGETTAIFQFESEGMKKYLKELKPENIEDVMFMTAAYRPGPMQFIPDYIERKHGRQKVVYPHPDTKHILEKTYGFAIYQEQVMRIAVDMAGYSMGEADNLRRAMGKKKKEVMAAEKEKFLKGCVKKGYTEALAMKLFSYMEPFADYGFNRSHSLCYALNTYWSAYFKANYPVEFMAGLMHTDQDVPDKIKRDLAECERMKIKVKPPNINKSDVDFTIEGTNTIRFGLGAIKGVGNKSVAVAVKERDENGEFKNLEELISRVGTDNINKKTLECLIKVGALDQFGSRKLLLEQMPALINKINKHLKKISGGQTDMFGSIKNNHDDSSQFGDTFIPEVKEESEREKLEWEKELLGAYISGHPLKKYMNYYDGKEILTINEAKQNKPNHSVKIGGIITEKKIIQTKRGNKNMAFVKIEGLEQQTEGVLFTDTYERLKDKIDEFQPMVISGKTSLRNGQFSVIIDDMMRFRKFKPIFDLSTDQTITLDLSNEHDSTNLKELKEAIINNPGKSPIHIYYNGNKGNKKKKLIKRKIDLNPTMIRVIRRYVIN